MKNALLERCFYFLKCALWCVGVQLSSDLYLIMKIGYIPYFSGWYCAIKAGNGERFSVDDTRNFGWRKLVLYGVNTKYLQNILFLWLFCCIIDLNECNGYTRIFAFFCQATFEKINSKGIYDTWKKIWNQGWLTGK